MCCQEMTRTRSGEHGARSATRLRLGRLRHVFATVASSLADDVTPHRHYSEGHVNTSRPRSKESCGHAGNPLPGVLEWVDPEHISRCSFQKSLRLTCIVND